MSGKRFPNTLIRKIGSIIGRCRTKEPDIYQSFIDVCNATGQKPTDVLIQFMTWFVEQGGISLFDVGSLSKQKQIGETFTELNSVQQIAEIAKNAIAENLQREMEMKQNIIQMSQEYMNVFSQLQQQIATLQQQLADIKQQKQLIEAEKQKIEAEKMLLQQMKQNQTSSQKRGKKS